MKSFGLLKIDHHTADIYTLGGKEEHKITEETLQDPKHLHWHLHNKKVKNGTSKPNDTAYFKEVYNDIKGFDSIIVASHGTGKSNEGANFIKFLEQHHKDIASKVYGTVATDDHETEAQLLAKVDYDALLVHLKK
ncbi:hypothetical protein [Flammeovirga kamogawensis]|uniref:Smr/MutS family protein n=1 Tax=Flammeovirga kamogawensis TaxID=373891 RepID=A0ABX8GPY4_9BACT|nr:hypothetical protein [Flammeovirga kamogawensis]MBB6463491.1 hypothetical protein [Flammeovirga kamogawensis]QWG05583.1 hypothetical protein KM029_09325 [Flammeovirga kamogawensis]TRX67414.1 hypothetical protein EO216_04360 [Flammeovirga kamogawensis]